MQVGEYIRNRRKESKRSLRALATDLHVDTAYLSRVEAGKVRPSTSLLDAVARVLSLDPAETGLLAGQLPDEWLPAIQENPEAATATLRTAMRLLIKDSAIAYGRALLTEGGDRLIEDGFPFEAVSDIAEIESWRKEIYRPIYHLHKWWAQRLGSVFRAILVGATAPRGSNLMELFYQPVRLPSVVVFDPFMGSGTTVGEALKLGCTAIGRDINPVAYNVVKVALGDLDRSNLIATFKELEASIGKEICDLYRGKDNLGRTCDVLYYFWVKHIDCPACAHRVDLFTTYVFARHAYPKRYPEAFASCPFCSAIVPVRYDAHDAKCHHCHLSFDPSSGPAKQNTAICPVCMREFSIAKTVQAVGAPPSHRMYAKLVLTLDGRKEYLPIDDEDERLYAAAGARLQSLIDAYPVVPIQDGYNTHQVLNYGYRYWHQMFNERQLLALSLLGRAIADLPAGSTRDALLCLFSGTLEFNNMFASYKGEGTGAVRHMFAHHILKPERTPLEANLWGTSKSSGAFSTLFRSRLLRAIEYRQVPFELKPRTSGKRDAGTKVFGLSRSMNYAIAHSYADLNDKGQQLYLSCGSSTHTDLPHQSVDLVVTDPPFFDNVHYSELADFFYVWQRHFAGDDNLSTWTTRHTEEVQHKDASTFERNLAAVFTECNRVLKDDGLLIFTYHHSREEGWVSVARAVLSAGLTFTQAQPVKAEMSVATPKSAAKEPINLDVILVCRKSRRAAPRAGKPTVCAVDMAAQQMAGFNHVGRMLSRNDVRVVLMGQVLVDASAQASLPAALDKVEEARHWITAEVERLYLGQSAPASKKLHAYAQGQLFV